MSICELDHIAVTAPTLQAGVDWVHDVLGVAPAGGGEHPAMGTHNHLLRLGPSTYLEVIAVNPAAPAPERARWFGLDTLEPNAPPRLRTWIARTDNIAAALADAGEILGGVTPMTRGALQWLITIPEDGKPPLGGCAPALIQWMGHQPHPAAGLPDHGLRLRGLELFHPRPYRVMALLQAMGVSGPIQVRRSAEDEGSSLTAHIDTPQGLCSLSTRG
ncbi:MAG: VOC family protein [Burkholderiaceae bacterium]